MRGALALLLAAACGGASSEPNVPAEPTPAAEVPEAQPTPELLVRAPKGEQPADEPSPTDDPPPPSDEPQASASHPVDVLPAEPDDTVLSRGPVQGRGIPYSRRRAPAAPKITAPRIKGTFSCSFPSNTDGIDEAIVPIDVLIGADGIARSATILLDPGHGFGLAAKACVLKQAYVPARDAASKPVEANLKLHVRFMR